MQAQPPNPTTREAGNASAPGVICLHSNASSASQWRGLLDQLAPDFHVFAPDSYDSGQSPSWPSDRIISLSDEVALIEPVLARAAQGVARVLGATLPQVEVVEFGQLGHMGPVTHADVVNPVIARFLRRCIGLD